MAHFSGESFVQIHKKYHKQKGGQQDLRTTASFFTGSTKQTIKETECKVCKVLATSASLARVLNQGLYLKYSSSQDFFYTKDLNNLILKKRLPYCIKYYDDLVFDECEERLKKFYKKKNVKYMMTEITDFYEKFRHYPKVFHRRFEDIMKLNMKRHRRLEYLQVFKNPITEEEENVGKVLRKEQMFDKNNEQKNNESFKIMEMLGETFLDSKNHGRNHNGVGERTDTECLLREIESNFEELKKKSISKNAVSDLETSPFSNALYNENFLLFSHRDSEQAKELLREIVVADPNLDMSQPLTSLIEDKTFKQFKKIHLKKTNSEGKFSPVLKSKINFAGTGTGNGNGNASPSIRIVDCHENILTENFNTQTKFQLLSSVLKVSSSSKNIDREKRNSHKDTSSNRPSEPGRAKIKMVIDNPDQFESYGHPRVKLVLDSQKRSTRTKSVMKILSTDLKNLTKTSSKHENETSGLENCDSKIIVQPGQLNHSKSQSFSPGLKFSKELTRTPSSKEYNNVILLKKYFPQKNQRSSSKESCDPVQSTNLDSHKTVYKKSKTLTRKETANLGQSTKVKYIWNLNDASLCDSQGRKTLEGSPVNLNGRVANPAMSQTRIGNRPEHTKSNSSLTDKGNLTDKFYISTKLTQSNVVSCKNRSPSRIKKDEFMITSMTKRYKPNELTQEPQTPSSALSKIYAGKEQQSQTKSKIKLEIQSYPSKLTKKDISSVATPITYFSASDVIKKKTRKVSEVPQKAL